MTDNISEIVAVGLVEVFLILVPVLFVVFLVRYFIINK